MGNQSIGNFLDGIFFGTAPHVVLTKTAAPTGPLEVGDVITYRVNARNEGGGAAENLVLTDVIPQGTTYLPGSLRIVDGPNAGPKTDARGDDQAYYDAQSGKVVFALGNTATEAGGSLPSTETLPGGTTAEYRVTIDRAAGGQQLRNTATASYENRLGDTPEPLTATSNEQVTQVNPAADLAVAKAADATTVTVGQTVTYRVTVHNMRPEPGHRRHRHRPAPGRSRLPVRRRPRELRPGHRTVGRGHPGRRLRGHPRAAGQGHPDRLRRQHRHGHRQRKGSRHRQQHRHRDHLRQ